MSVPSFIATAVDSWAAFYDAHQAVSVTVRYLHLAGLLMGGGTALVADRRVLGAGRPEPSRRAATLEVLRSSHRIVVPALVVVVATGILMTATDTDTFLASRLYWLKLGFVVVLLLNGLGLLVAESAAGRNPTGSGWGWLRLVSGASLVLWLLILYLGVLLTVAA